MQTGPEEPAGWRRTGATADRPHLVPDLMLPRIGPGWYRHCGTTTETFVDGPVALLNHPDLRSRVRRVSLGEDATAPGHRAI